VIDHEWGKILHARPYCCSNYYLGFGLFLTIFFPYFLHLNPSSRTSTSDIVLNATLSLTASLLSLPVLSSSLAATQKKIKDLNIQREREREMFKLFGSKETINIRHGNQVLLEEKIVSLIKWEVIAIRKFKRSRENERLCGSWGTIVHEKILG
jgi:hypothetical protein